MPGESIFGYKKRKSMDFTDQMDNVFSNDDEIF